MLRTLFFVLAALAPAAYAAPGVEQDAVPGLPAVKVQDLHYGDVLFHFYQPRPLRVAGAPVGVSRAGPPGSACARCRAPARRPLPLARPASRGARNLRKAARRHDNADASPRPGLVLPRQGALRDRALSRNPTRSLRAVSRHAVGRRRGRTPAPDRAGAHLSRASSTRPSPNCRTGRGPDDWTALRTIQPRRCAGAREARRDGLAMLDRSGCCRRQCQNCMALRDKANLALGYVHCCRPEQPAAARVALDRVRLNGSQVDKALLGAGWADAAGGDYQAGARALGGAARPRPARRRGPGVLSRRSVCLCGAVGDRPGRRILRAGDRGLRRRARAHRGIDRRDPRRATC